MKIEYAELGQDPVQPMDAVTKRYVDQSVAAGVAIVGGVFITDITPTSTGIVGGKVYEPNTVPANVIVNTATSDTPNVRISFMAEGGSAFYSPQVTVNGVVGTLIENATDKRNFNGYADLVLTGPTATVTVTSSTGATDTATVNIAGAGPVIQTLTIGALPGGQTEAKQGDIVPVTGSVPNTATGAEIILLGAANAQSTLVVGAADSAGAGFKTITGTFVVSGATGAQKVTARARNSLGTWGANALSGNSITLNQTYPTIAVPTFTYPGGQTAVKNGEVVTANAVVSSADVVAYTTLGGSNLGVASPSVYAAAKTVTYSGTGAYVVGTNNYTITATKVSNGAVTTRSAAISVADSAATAAITIVGSPARLISSAAGQTYTVRIQANQVLASAPSLTASAGTWSGSWTFGAGFWSRTLTVRDSDTRGAQTFSGLTLPGQAGVVGTTITSGAAYTIGGFLIRTITFAAFSQIAPLGVSVENAAKINAQYAGTGSNLTLRTDTGAAAASFTIVDLDGTYNPKGAFIWLSDAAFAGANTSGTLQVTVEEIA